MDCRASTVTAAMMREEAKANGRMMPGGSTFSKLTIVEQGGVEGLVKLLKDAQGYFFLPAFFLGLALRSIILAMSQAASFSPLGPRW